MEDNLDGPDCGFVKVDPPKVKHIELPAYAEVPLIDQAGFAGSSVNSEVEIQPDAEQMRPDVWVHRSSVASSRSTHANNLSGTGRTDARS